MADEFDTNIIPGWKGDTVEGQTELFEHIFMYILQRSQVDDVLLSESEWVKFCKPVVLDHAGFYATDIFDDVLAAYVVEDLLNFRGYCTHHRDENILRKIYLLYTRFRNNRCTYVHDQYCDLYLRIDAMIDEEVKGRRKNEKTFLFFTQQDYFPRKSVSFVCFVRNIFASRSFMSSRCFSHSSPAFWIASSSIGVSGRKNFSPVFTY